MFEGSFSDVINPASYKVEQKYRLHQYQHVIVTRNKTNRDESVALRLRVGRQGYSQWLNELSVYLLPNFSHINILPFLGCEKTLHTDNDEVFQSDDLLQDMPLEEDEIVEKSPIITRIDEHGNRVFVENKPKEGEEVVRANFDYWILNDYAGCITLRHYMMMYTLNWPQMIQIALGIVNGLNYLHEQADYHFDDVSTKKAVDGFIRSTRGALKKISFRDPSGIIHLKPPHLLTIVHRNLSSLNIVLRPDSTPCIWNFGYAYVYHPFQPMNHDHLVDKPIKNIHMTSPYSPPEVLTERAYFTLTHMKSIDMYACGMIFWELLSRCVLPKLEEASPEEIRERRDPEDYSEPFMREFCGRTQVLRQMLYHAVVRKRTRPRIKYSWLIGKKTNRMVQIIRELWDSDYEARLHTSTVIDRLSKLSLRDRDKRYKYPIIDERVFDLDTMWPPDIESTQAPIVFKRESTIFYEELSIPANNGEEEAGGEGEPAEHGEEREGEPAEPKEGGGAEEEREPLAPVQEEDEEEEDEEEIEDEEEEGEEQGEQAGPERGGDREAPGPEEEGERKPPGPEGLPA